MVLSVQDREMIHFLQEDGLFEGDPLKYNIQKEVQKSYKELKKYIVSIKKEKKAVSRRGICRILSCFYHVMKLYCWAFYHKKSHHDIAWKVLEGLGLDTLDAEDLGYFSPDILLEMNEIYSHLHISSLSPSFCKGASLMRIKKKLEPESMKKAIKASTGGWETDLDRRIQFVLASIMKDV